MNVLYCNNFDPKKKKLEDISAIKYNYNIKYLRLINNNLHTLKDIEELDVIEDFKVGGNPLPYTALDLETVMKEIKEETFRIDLVKFGIKHKRELPNKVLPVKYDKGFFYDNKDNKYSIFSFTIPKIKTFEQFNFNI